MHEHRCSHYSALCLAFILVLSTYCQALSVYGISRKSITQMNVRHVPKHSLISKLQAQYDNDNINEDLNEVSEDDEDLTPSKRRISEERNSFGNESEKRYSTPSKNRNKKRGLFNRVPKALLAGIFVLGIGTGVTMDSAINTNPKDLASRDAIDKNAPNPTICQTYGSSAMVVDERVFVTFNPFSIYVAPADVKPGCVLRQANFVSVLKSRNLITDAEVQTCKGGMNTWAFVGDLNGKPQLSCVYQSDDAQNEFLSDPKVGLGEDVYDDDRVSMTKNTNTVPQATGMKVGEK